jgi:group I intron endonuclease
MEHLVYLTRNLVNGKIYIGVHAQKNEGFDGYLGSGKTIIKAVKKYGKDVFIRETLRICDNHWEASCLEAFIVTLDFVQRKDTYNIKLGGQRGKHKWTEEQRAKQSERKMGKSNGSHRDETKRKIGIGNSKPSPAKSLIRLNASQEWKDKIKKSLKRQRTCPYCGKTGSTSPMGQWHFENCRQKPETAITQ